MLGLSELAGEMCVHRAVAACMPMMGPGRATSVLQRPGWCLPRSMLSFANVYMLDGRFARVMPHAMPA